MFMHWCAWVAVFSDEQGQSGTKQMSKYSRTTTDSTKIFKITKAFLGLPRWH